MLNKATSADDVPTPGYMFTEIAKSTGDVNACQQLADYLIKKLERDNPQVKVKVLRIIRHVCDTGKPEFRRAVQKRADVVKSCLQYRGTPDPLKGDAPNKAVRDEADAAIKSVFSSDSSANAYGLSTEPAKKMQGFGSDSAAGGGGDSYSGRMGGFGNESSYGGSGGFGGGGGGAKSFGSSGGGGMVGFGNPNFNNEPKPDNDTMFKSAMSSTMSAVSKFSNKVQEFRGGNMPTHNEPPTSSYRAPPAPNMGADSGFGTGVKGRWGSDIPPSRSSAPAHAGSSGDYEARVVGELCAVGGPRVAPSAQALEDFCRKCESLDSDCVATQLRSKLASSDWQSRLKALHAIESLSQHGLDGIVGHLCEHSSELLFDCQGITQCKQKATKVLHMLGFTDAPEKSSVRAQQPAPVAALASATAPPVADLLDFGGPDPAPTAPDSAPYASVNGVQGAAPGVIDMLGSSSDMLGVGGGAPLAPAASCSDGLFGGLTTKNTDPHLAVSEPPSLLASIEAAAQTQPHSQSAPSEPSLFGGLQLNGASVASTAPAGVAPMTGFSPAFVPEMAQMPGVAPGVATGTPYQAPMAPNPSPTFDGARAAHLNVLSGGAAGGGQMWGNMMAPPFSGQPGMQGSMGAQMGSAQQPLSMRPSTSTPMGMQPMGLPGMGLPNMGMGMPSMGVGMGMGMPSMSMGMAPASQMPMGVGAMPGMGAMQQMQMPPNSLDGAASGLAPPPAAQPARTDSAFGFVADMM